MSVAKAPALADRALHACAFVLFVGMCALVLAQVVMRKFFEPLVWSEELARYVFIWVCYLGWAIASRRRSHVAVTLVRDRAGPRMRRLLAALSEIATLVLAAVLLRWGWQLVLNNRDVETVTLFFSYALVYAVVPLCGLLIGWTALAELWRLARGGDVDDGGAAAAAAEALS